MKKIIRIFMMAFLPFLLCAGMTLPVHAMSDEEKELFDMLGAEYVLDENGDFKEFIANETIVDEIMSRFTVEQKMALAKKYEGTTQVGKYNIKAYADETSNVAGIYINDKDGRNIFCVDTCQVNGDAMIAYVNANQDFFALHFDDITCEDLTVYAIGTKGINEKTQMNPITQYYRGEDGTFRIRYKTDGETIFYTYDEDGELYQWRDLATGITYDVEDNPVAKHINTTDTFGLHESVPYDVADEVQRLVDANDGSFNVYRDDLDAYITMPEIDQLLYESGMAKKLGMTLEEYRKEHDAYEEYTSKIVYGACVRADILEVPEEHLWNTPEQLAEGEIPSNITPTGIAQELAKLINDYRVENGLKPLDASDPLLQQVADLRAQEATYVMDGAHSRPMGGNAADSFHVGENLAMTSFPQDTSNKEIAQKIFGMWKKSPGHNANMLHKDYQLGALGVQFVKENGALAVYVSHDFSRMSDYQNRVSDIIKKRIEIGAQIPGNIESMQDYYLQLYGTETIYLTNAREIEESEKGASTQGAAPEAAQGTEQEATADTSQEAMGSYWTTFPGGKSIMQPLTGDVVPINGVTPAIVLTQDEETPVGEQVKLVLLDANYNQISTRVAIGDADDIEHTKYKYVYFTQVNFIGDRVIFRVAGTDTPMSGNLYYGGEGTWDTENGSQTGAMYYDNGGYGGGY